MAMEQLLIRIAARDNLLVSFHEVRSKRGSAGVDRVSVEDFAAALDDELTRLAEELLAGSYRPAPVLRVRPSGVAEERPITVPTVRDRVAQRAIGRVLARLLDGTFLDCSYAYRPGRSASLAAGRLEQGLAAGLSWVLRGDVEKLFERIDHRRCRGAARGLRALHPPRRRPERPAGGSERAGRGSRPDGRRRHRG